MKWDFDSFRAPPRKDWTPERTIALPRARVSLECVHHDPVKGGRIWKVRFRRFCFGDYRRQQLSIYENTASLTFRLTQNKDEQWRYLISFKRGRLAFYKVTRGEDGSTIKRAVPLNHQFSVTAPIRENYPAAFSRYGARLIKLIRAKARTNGVRLPLPAAGQTQVAEYLMDCLYPAHRDLMAQLTVAGLNPLQADARAKQRHLLPALRGDTADVVRRATGYRSKAVSKLFWGRLAEAEWPHRVGWATLIRTFLPVDYTQQLLAAPKVAQFDARTWSNRAAVVRLLKTFTPKRVMGILQEPENGQIIRDAADAYTALWETGWRLTAPHGFKTITDLHDHLVRERRKLKERDFMLSVKWAEKVEGRVIGGFRLTAPTSAHQMGDWGSQMGNCIGGYASSVAAGHCQILGLMQEGRCHFGVEIRSRRIVQFRGRFNCSPPEHLLVAVEAALYEAKLLEGYPLAASPEVLVEPEAQAVQEPVGELVAAGGEGPPF